MRYALVKDGLVQSTFESDQPKEAFADIAEFLVEVDESVKDNMVTDGKTFTYPPAPRKSREARLAELTDEQFAKLIEMARA